VFNDVAVAIRVLQSAGKVRHGVVIDLDVHQGNGTASIFADDSTVFTFSMHAENNFPFHKCDGDLDIALPDGTSDEDYLARLHEALNDQIPLGATDIAFYLAGADPYEHDRLGKLNLTMAGLVERDRTVFAACKRHKLPVTVVMAGGYAKRLDDVVQINISTIRTLL
jgi:acetoin utilization deacetylase AcuC-like enzyme